MEKGLLIVTKQQRVVTKPAVTPALRSVLQLIITSLFWSTFLCEPSFRQQLFQWKGSDPQLETRWWTWIQLECWTAFDQVYKQSSKLMLIMLCFLLHVHICILWKLFWIAYCNSIKIHQVSVRTKQDTITKHSRVHFLLQCII